MARLQADDPTEADLATIERTLAEVGRKQANLARRVADEEDDDTAALLGVELRRLAELGRGLDSEREGILGRRRSWAVARERLDDLGRWCRRVASNLDGLVYEERRLALDALGVRARVWRADHEPRWEIATDIDLGCVATGSTTPATSWPTWPPRCRTTA